ncbi:hypothetical protein [Sediminibacterium ginsengisoli]|nr:hypothetical protein [Sediminibacterium ginsengisoli]
MRFVRDVPRDVLTTARDRALGVRDEDVLVSRGAIFTGIINEYLNDIHAGAGH